MPTDISIRPAHAGDFATAVAWLSGAGLPTADLRVEQMPSFLVASRGDEVLGIVGLERFAAVGLLRSLVVAATARGAGIGARLVAALEAAARTAGVDELWLLTIDADGFFLRHGFSVQARDQAPASIQATAEFSSLCPGDAVLMRKPLR